MPLIKNISISLPDNFEQIAADSIPGIREIPGALEKIKVYTEMLLEADDFSYLYKIFTCKLNSNNQITFENSRFFNIENISKIFGNPEICVIYFASMGGCIDDEINNFLNNDMIFDAYLYKNIASLLLNCSTLSCKELISEKIYNEYGFKCSCSYSPGYQNWRIEEQSKLFSMLDPSIINLYLDENFIMHPSISVSGIFTAGQKVNAKAATCDFCSEENCYLK